MKRSGVFYGTDGLREEIELLKRIGVLIKGEAVDWFIILCILVSLSVGTYQRNILWNNELALWKDCVEKSPRKERAHHNLGYVYYELGRWDEASKEFEEALKLNPHYALSVYNLGLISYRKGCVDTAIDLYKKAIKLDARFPYSFYNLGIAYYQKGFYQDAIRAFEEFVRLKPDYENAHNCLGLAYQGLGQREQAIRSFREELKYHPENSYADIYLGDIYRESRNYSVALFHYKRALTRQDSSHAGKIRKAISAVAIAQKNKTIRGG